MAAPMKEWDVEVAASCVAVVSTENAQRLRKCLEAGGFWDSERKLKKQSSGTVVIPIKEESVVSLKPYQTVASEEYQLNGITFKLDRITLQSSRKVTLKSPYSSLVDSLKSLLANQETKWTVNFEADIPSSWEKHGDLLMLPSNSFQHEVWSLFGDDLWRTVADSLGCKRVARRDVIASDSFRSPQVSLLYGDSGWVDRVDNGIKCSYDVTRCMFSSGNITEKLRIAKFNCRGETVVDLYAGIGYFTLPYLVHAGAAMVHACEWNPDAVSALRINLKQNQVLPWCMVHEGDNREVCPRGIADRVNLGLIPSSEAGWGVACAALKPDVGGVLHVHGNVITSRHVAIHEPLTVLLDEQGNAVVKTGSEQEVHKISSKEDLCADIDLLVAKVKDDVRTNLNRSHIIEAESNSQQLHHQSEASQIKQCEPVRQPQQCNKDNNAENNVTCDGESQTGNWVSETDLFSSQEYDLHEQSNKIQNEIHSSGSNKKTEAKCTRRRQWECWGSYVADRITCMMTDLHGGLWRTNVTHIEHVKSYAPNNNHLVCDVKCRPFH